MKCSLLATLVLARCILADAQIRLFHRIYHPLEHQVSFSYRGSIHVAASGGAHFHPSGTAPHDLLHFAESTQHLDGTLYQVALQRDSDPNDGHWDFSSVKAVCAHQFSPNETDPSASLLASVSSSVPHCGSPCPPSHRGRKSIRN